MSDDKRPRPIPVRPASGPTPARGSGPPPSSERSPESLSWTSPDGREWVVQIEGRSRTGRGTDPAAELALVVFRPAAAGAGEGAVDPQEGAVETLAVVESVQGLSDLEIAGLFSASRPFRPVPPVTRDAPSSRRRFRRG